MTKSTIIFRIISNSTITCYYIQQVTDRVPDLGLSDTRDLLKVKNGFRASLAKAFLLFFAIYDDFSKWNTLFNLSFKTPFLHGTTSKTRNPDFGYLPDPSLTNYNLLG